MWYIVYDIEYSIEYMAYPIWTEHDGNGLLSRGFRFLLG